MKTIIYMPAYNEAQNIQDVISNLPRTLPRVEDVLYLVIDDGSTDETAVLASGAGARVVSHGKNRGVGAAFHSAVEFTLENAADILVGIDADGQFDAAEIPNLIQPILDGRADMVIGNRFANGIPAHMSRVKYWGNQRVAGLIRSITGLTFNDVSCGFRAYNREALLHLNLFGEFTYTHETILSLHYQGLRVMEYPVKVKYYPDRESRVANSIFSYAIQTSKIIFRAMLDYRPMQIFGSAAGVLALIGIAFVVFMLVHYAVTASFTPYKSFGFIGLGFFIFGALVFLVALVTDMLNRLRRNQDKLLYEMKRYRYEKR